VNVRQTAATSKKLDRPPGGRTAGRVPGDPVRPPSARAREAPLVFIGAVGGGLLFALALMRLFTPPDEPIGGAFDEQAVRDWLLAVSAAASFGFALLAYDRHRALLAARRAEQSFRKLYDSISEGVFRSTLDGKMISANPALVRLNGYETEEELIRCCSDIANEWYVDSSRRAEIHQMLLKTDKVTNVVSEVFRHKTRERIWIEESVRLVREERTGRPLYYAGPLRQDCIDHVGLPLPASPKSGRNSLHALRQHRPLPYLRRSPGGGA
jgi:PAS domain S-box-containing protein